MVTQVWLPGKRRIFFFSRYWGLNSRPHAYFYHLSHSTNLRGGFLVLVLFLSSQGRDCDCDWHSLGLVVTLGTHTYEQGRKLESYPYRMNRLLSGHPLRKGRREKHRPVEKPFSARRNAWAMARRHSVYGVF
jgi:hypothetical protein